MLQLHNIGLNRQISYLKPKQIDSLDALVLKKQDVIAVLPTGYGKSLIFDLIPFVCISFIDNVKTTDDEPLILVISPLDAIINKKLRAWGHKACSVGDIKKKSSKQPELQEEHDLSDNPTYVIGHPEQFISAEVVTIFASSKWQTRNVC